MRMEIHSVPGLVHQQNAPSLPQPEILPSPPPLTVVFTDIGFLETDLTPVYPVVLVRLMHVRRS